MPFLASSGNNPEKKPISEFDSSIAHIDSKDLKELKFQLSHTLQSSLELEEMLGSFYRMLKKVVTVSSVEYSIKEKQIQLCLGQSKTHSSTYQLKVHNHSIGQITFTRSKRFSEEDLKSLEEMIAVLVLPLRNALMYRDALQSSLRDPLTGVGNRAAMELTLKRELKLSNREQTDLSLLVVDIDHFKKINDSAGHQAGDQALKKVAKIISSTLRQTDQVFRYGGEEFVVVLAGTAHDHAQIIAERIRASVETTHIRNVPNPVCVSIGVSSKAEDDDRDSLFERADAALYAAKQGGRNRVISEQWLIDHLPESKGRAS